MDRSEINEYIGRRLRFERRRRGLSQAEVAERCGTYFQQIHKYEMGLVSIPAVTLWRLAEALSMRVGDLFPAPECEGVRPPLDRGGAEARA